MQMVRVWQYGGGRPPQQKITTTYRAGGVATKTTNGKANGGNGLARLFDGM